MKPDPDSTALRRRAEAQLQEKLAPPPLSPEADLRRLQHELEVHQIELEMQNDALREAQGKLAAALERYTDHFDFAPVGYFNLSADGTVKLVNLTGAKLVGVERGHLVDRCLAQWIAEAERPAFSQFLARVFASGTKESCELSLGRPGRPPLCGLLEATLSPDGQECRAVLIDVTERKALEEQVRRAQRVAAIGTLAAGIAHDLNNTLTPIVLGVGMLEEHIEQPGDRELLEVIRSSSIRGSELVRQMLTFSRGVEGERVAVQVRLLCKELNAHMQETFPRDLVLETDVAGDLWPVRGDPTQLHQVLLNLCLNARDAMPNGGRLTLMAKNVELSAAEVRAHPPAQPGPHVALTVRDTGHGIPPEIIERIFDPFFTTKTREKGTGLGLSTAFGIVHSHAGFITVASTPGRGATFTVFLPAAAGTAEAVAAPAEPAPHGHGELILVVDDEPMVCTSLQWALKEYGYEVVTAGDGAQALAVFQQRHREVRLVLTDVMMPVLGGAELARALRRAEPTLRLIAFSGVLRPEIRAELTAAGIDSFLMKPCGARELLQAIAQQLARAV